MSGSLSPTVASTPTATQVATDIMANMAALSGVLTDYNVGSQIRTLAESIGAVTEADGISQQALVLQALAYSALSLFNITPAGATSASGVVTFATAFPSGSAPVATQSVPIPSGTLMQTAGGVVFQTVTNVTLPSGAQAISVGILAVQGGAAGNVPAEAITGFPLSSVGYPVYVQNAAPTAGGADAESPSSALARFTATVDALGLSSPFAVANAAVGVTASGETVRFAACYEPWIVAGTGAGSGTAGFILYIDDGAGAASSGLIDAVSGWITGDVLTQQSGYRPAGVPFQVLAVNPVYAAVSVSGTLVPGLIDPTTVANTATSGIIGYFSSLGFQVAAQQASIAAEAANAGLGFFETLTVTLTYSGSPTGVPYVSGGADSRIILSGLDVQIGVGT